MPTSGRLPDRPQLFVSELSGCAGRRGLVPEYRRNRDRTIDPGILARQEGERGTVDHPATLRGCVDRRPMIPIDNLYYLLCYSWNRLEDRDLVDVSALPHKDLPNL